MSESNQLLQVPGATEGDFQVRRNRSASIAFVDYFTTPQDIQSYDGEDGRRPSIPIYDDSNQEHQETIDNIIFNMFEDESGEILVGKFIAGLEISGLKRTDLRLKEMFQNLHQLLKEEEARHKGHRNDDFVGSIETLRLKRETFTDIILPNIIIVSAAFRQQFIIPKFDVFCQQIEEIYLECKEITTGKVAHHIKQLGRMDSNYWGVSICTIDGQRYSIGDTNVHITLHATSKPIMYGIALDKLGKDLVHKYVGQEPSGHMFNDLVLDFDKRPHNPLINSGGIMVQALLQNLAWPDLSLSAKFDSAQEYYLKMSGGEYIGFNNAVLLAKKETSDRSWALGHFMKEYDCFPPGTDLNDCIEFYLQSNSIESTCEVMSVVASTLANGGICPITGERALKEDSVAHVLSLMRSCGMFDYSGKFAFKIGLPAKSSISGLILLVIPNVCGMALWSPSLDSFSNFVSARGLAFCEKLVQVFNFHVYDNIRTTSEKIDPTRQSRDTKGSNTIMLLFSAGSGDMNSIIRLHLSGIDMGLYDCDGRTALHLASSEGHIKMVEYLLKQCGVNHLRKDRWGNLPFDEAVQFGHKDIAELLRSWASDHKAVSVQ